ncbi:sodium-coupled monocarboxylate transporter 1-like [Plakobranchus ocellatus]|uniref:Sodium-coupled monocarboxylate transporter 1-like n=1 Tax=Plakobranchus ocellatus TaxID=259542 RepID=A0AAV3Y455_9GAST|nr:sodium-coupled monocarboxylate transporter 1-like [Plakobranchus ocellatus]
MELNDSCRTPGTKRLPEFKGNYSFNTGKLTGLSALDYFFLAGTLAVSTVIGLRQIWNNYAEITLDEFLHAGRSMSPVPIGLSIMASVVSAITLLGVPADVYTHSPAYVWILVAVFLTIATSAHIFVPFFYRLRISTVHEVCEYTYLSCACSS